MVQYILTRKDKSSTYFNYKIKILKMKIYEKKKSISNAKKNSCFKSHAWNLDFFGKHVQTFVCVHVVGGPQRDPDPFTCRHTQFHPKLKRTISAIVRSEADRALREASVRAPRTLRERATCERCTDLGLRHCGSDKSEGKEQPTGQGFVYPAYVKPKSTFLRS